jgi:hypothetical protein
MRVSIYKSRHDDPPARINDFAIRLYERLDLPSRTNPLDTPFAHQHRSILDN